MSRNLRLAFTADLHWGSRPAGDAATLALVSFLRAQPPDVLVLAGDVGAGQHFGSCLELFAELPCVKALVPGNHDIWVTDPDERGDSLSVYQQHLPALCKSHGFHYLDAAPLLLPEAGLALVGSINWYDYSWSIEALRQQLPDHEQRLKEKRFSRGRHNDARFVRWELDDVRFTAQVVAALDQQLQEALERVESAIVVVHHPPFQGLNFPPKDEPPSIDRLLWEAYSGNTALEQVLAKHAAQVPFAFCGHTHRARENTLAGIQGHNIGGDYHFKRLLTLDWPVGTLAAQEFGDVEAPARFS